MLARWLAKLQQFNFDIVHRHSAQHGNADGLSRCPQCERGTCTPTTDTSHSDPEQPYATSCIGSSLDSELIPLESGETCVAAVMIAQSKNSKLITTAQKTDSEISIVREWIVTGKFPACIQDFAPASYELKAYWIGRKSLFLDKENILWRNRSEAGSRAQLVVPRSLRDTIFNDSHHTTYGGHFGITHTHSKIQLHYFWPGMSDFVRDRITACHKCVARKSPVNRHQPMGHVPVSGRFERVAMDLLDVSVISARGYRYILVVCDYFTKYTEAYPLKDKTARSVADALMDIWLPRYGFRASILQYNNLARGTPVFCASAPQYIQSRLGEHPLSAQPCNDTTAQLPQGLGSPPNSPPRLRETLYTTLLVIPVLSSFSYSQLPRILCRTNGLPDSSGLYHSVGEACQNRLTTRLTIRHRSLARLHAIFNTILHLGITHLIQR